MLSCIFTATQIRKENKLCHKYLIQIPFSTWIWAKHKLFYIGQSFLYVFTDKFFDIFPDVFPHFTQMTSLNIKTELSSSEGLAVLIESWCMNPMDGLQTSAQATFILHFWASHLHYNHYYIFPSLNCFHNTNLSACVQKYPITKLFGFFSSKCWYFSPHQFTLFWDLGQTSPSPKPGKTRGSLDTAESERVSLCHRKAVNDSFIIEFTTGGKHKTEELFHARHNILPILII